MHEKHIDQQGGHNINQDWNACPSRDLQHRNKLWKGWQSRYGDNYFGK